MADDQEDGIPADQDNSDSSVSSDTPRAVENNSLSGMTFNTRDVPLPEAESWFKTYWRPAAAWLYLFINLFDFVIAPVITMIMPKLLGSAYIPWTPLTLSNGGMFHLSMGAIIGVTAWGRTRERVNGLISGG